MSTPHGRARELARVHDAFAGGARLVTLLGPPGVGKTHLARHLVSMVTQGRPPLAAAAAVFVEVADATEEAELVARVREAFALGAQSDPGEELALLVDRFDALSPLIVLDGLERAAPMARETIAVWLDASPSLTLLVTSRERLDVPGEVVVTLAPLERADAVQLFVELVRRIDHERHVDEVVAARIVDRLDRLPLALELSAPRAARLGLAELARLLDEDARDGLPHTDVLVRAMEGSWSQLDPAEQRVLVACSVFRGGFTLDALRAILADAPSLVDLSARAGELVTALGDASLLMGRDLAEGARFELLVVVRAFAIERLDELGLGETLRDAHARVFAAMAARPVDDRRSWRTSSTERENLLAAYAHVRGRSPDVAVTLALGLHTLLVRQGPPELQVRMLEESLACATTPAQRIDLSIALARHVGLRGAHARTVQLLDAAAELARGIGDHARLGWAEALSCFSLRPLGRLIEARARAMTTLGIARAVSDPRLEAMTEQVVGLIDLAEENPLDAAVRFRAAAAIARTSSAPRLEGISLANLAESSLRQGRIDEATAFLREAQVLFESIDDRVHVVKCAVRDVKLARLRGELDRADSMAREALDQAREHDDLMVQIELRGELARIALGRGDARLARRFVEEGEALARRVDDVELTAMLRTVRGELISDEEIEPLLRIAHDGTTFTFGETTVDLRRRAPLRRLLAALALARIEGEGLSLDVAAMLAAGWPGERMSASSGAARVYMAVRRLRALGLERVLVTDELGYRLDRGVPTAWLANVRRG